MSRVLNISIDGVFHSVVRRSVNKFYNWGLKSFPDKYYRVHEDEYYTDLDDDTLSKYRDIIDFGLNTHAYIHINGEYIIAGWKNGGIYVNKDTFEYCNSFQESICYDELGESGPSYFTLAMLQDYDDLGCDDTPSRMRPKCFNGVHSESLNDLELMLGYIKLDDGNIINIE